MSQTDKPAGPRWRAAWPKYQPWVSLVLRLGLAAVALAASLPKLADLNNFRIAVAAFQVFPTAVSDLLAVAVPIIELTLGLALLAGLLTRYAALLFGLIMVAFIVGIAQAWIRGLNIDCGCFGGGGELPPGQDTKYGLDIARDVLFAAMATCLVFWPNSPASLDKVLRLEPVKKRADA